METVVDAEELELMAWVLCQANGIFMDAKGSKDFQNPIAIHTDHRK